ncbi:MAG: sterol desaturase family protein [Lewinellaceae bacterium]|nr:sterol desaturase family protein [Saprospiraceae bacterium]MCB9342344.1 sterol desaturase family protein [Lewinellaceae bacterium]
MESLKEQLLLLISTPLYIGVILLEMVFSHYKHRKAYTLWDTLTNLYLMILNSGIDLLFRAVYVVIFQILYQYRVLEIQSPFWYWFWLVVGMDFLYYWLHRVDHFCRFFWAVHVTHHSSNHFNLTVGFRSSVFQPLYRFIYFIPLALCGFKPLDIVFIFSATQIWGILVHTEFVKKMGWLEYILVTPSHHRVHHAYNPLYLDRNMGMFLIIWDMMFGTFQKEMPVEEYDSIKYGLTKPIDKPNAVNIVFHEWSNILKDIRQKISLKAKFMYIFGPPGWSHDGSRQTSNQLRDMEAVERKQAV